MKIKVFEAFAGYGSQAMALQRVAEAITKVKAEAKKDFEKQLADKQKELDEAKKLAEQKTAGEPAPVKHEDKKEIPDWYKADKAARDKELEELRDAYKVLSESHNALKTENDTFKAEQRRVLFGFDQKTKLRVVQCGRDKISLRSNLRKHGYIIGRASNEAIITETTRRSAVMEERAKTMGIRFQFDFYEYFY